ncbi:MAG: trypsin-like peptidase domain-containing protein [Lentilitoribacter sp.]
MNAPLKSRREILKFGISTIIFTALNGETKAHDLNWADIIEQAIGAIVRLESIDQQQLGTGICVSAEGHIISNSHIFGEHDRVNAYFHDRSKVSGQLLDRQNLPDLALVKLESKSKNFKFLKFANIDEAKVGNPVVAIGMPLDYPFSVSSGIVSGFDRYYSDDHAVFLMQHDAALNPGNSGGALINDKGQILGINTATPPTTRHDIGIAFSVPADVAKNYVEHVLLDGTFEHSYLGARLRRISPEYSNYLSLDNTTGLLVERVEPYSPAAEGLLQAGDIIVSANNFHLTAPYQMARILWNLKPSSPLAVNILRGTQEISLSMETKPPNKINDGFKPSKLSKRQKQTTNLPTFGLSLINKILPSGGSVVLVDDVMMNSSAEQASLMSGDVLLKVNGLPLRDAQSALSILRTDDVALLLVSRQKSGQQYVLLDQSRPEASRDFTTGVDL